MATSYRNISLLCLSRQQPKRTHSADLGLGPYPLLSDPLETKVGDRKILDVMKETVFENIGRMFTHGLWKLRNHWSA